jgi:hypothetical protein
VFKVVKFFQQEVQVCVFLSRVVPTTAPVPDSLFGFQDLTCIPLYFSWNASEPPPKFLQDLHRWMSMRGRRSTSPKVIHFQNNVYVCDDKMFCKQEVLRPGVRGVFCLLGEGVLYLAQ